MPYYGYPLDTTWLILLPAIILSAWAQWRVNASFKKYAQIPSAGGWTAAAMARKLLDSHGLANVEITAVKGSLTDHYDPKNQVLALSQSVYGQSSLAALGVAAHEVGHAIQHAQGYKPIEWRSALVPVTNLGSRLAWPLMLLGILLSFPTLVSVGIALFVIVVLFQIVTLPVEFDASARALKLLEAEGYLQRQEMSGARAVLRAAAMTYLAAALSSILQLVRLVLISNRRRR